MKKFMCLLFLLFSFQSHANFEQTVVSWASKMYLSGNYQMTPTQECLAKNVWYEARGESRLGKTLVANVVRNRTTFGKPFANTICTVVYQKSQFSWTLNSSKKHAKFNTIMRKNLKNDEKNVRETIEIVLLQTIFNQKVVTKATHFTSEKPKFKRVQSLGVVGNHHFFRYLGNAKSVDS